MWTATALHCAARHLRVLLQMLVWFDRTSPHIVRNVSCIRLVAKIADQDGNRVRTQ